MEYDTDLAVQKKTELVQFAKEAIIACGKASGLECDPSKVEHAASEVIDSLVQITPPEKAPMVMEFLTLSRAGRRGGRSVKPGNLLLNMGKLFTAIASGILTTVSVIGTPWIAPFAALLLWDRVWSGLSIDISEREAALLWTMWKNRDHNNEVSEEGLLDLVNSELESSGRPPMSKQQMDDSLETLSRMSCVEQTTSLTNKWWLCEWIRVSYS
jgi:hypothetical protein